MRNEIRKKEKTAEAAGLLKFSFYISTKTVFHKDFCLIFVHVKSMPQLRFFFFFQTTCLKKIRGEISQIKTFNSNQ